MRGTQKEPKAKIMFCGEFLRLGTAEILHQRVLGCKVFLGTMECLASPY